MVRGDPERLDSPHRKTRYGPVFAVGNGPKDGVNHGDEIVHHHVLEGAEISHGAQT